MKDTETRKLSKGDRVKYRWLPMVVVNTAFALAKGMPVVVDLAWPEQPDVIVYRSIMARFCTLAARP